jgi:hypothetical protein
MSPESRMQYATLFLETLASRVDFGQALSTYIRQHSPDQA